MKRRLRWVAALAMTVVTAGFAGACGGGEGVQATQSAGAGAGLTSGSTGAGAGDQGGGGDLFGSGGGGSTGSGLSGKSLQIEPKDAILDVTGAPKTLQLVAKLSDGTSAGQVSWLLDDVIVGTMSPSGVFQSQGYVAGKAIVTAQTGTLKATTTITVRAKITDNPGQIDPKDQALLEAGGAADPAFRWLYPYDKSVFPRGLPAPSLQFGGAADAMLLEITAGGFEYKGFFGASTPARIKLPDLVWKALNKSAGANDPVKVEATRLSAGKVNGPVNATWQIAQGSLKGAIYYNTYQSKLASTGAVMRVRPGHEAEVLIGKCTVCHSVSAQGKVLAAGADWDNGDPVESQSFDLLDDGSTKPRYKTSDGRKFSFGALTPDGAWLLSNGVPTVWPYPRGLTGPSPSKLYDTATGAEIPMPSFASSVTYAVTPAFSPDGKRVAFNWHEMTNGRTLAVMDVDTAQSPPFFSNIKPVVEIKKGVAGWPSFLPDGEGVLFHMGDQFDTAGWGGDPAYGDLRLVDVATKTIRQLDALNGYENGQFTLPYGEAEEGHLNYEPSVLPVPVGGYYWVFFTSRRAYGNTIAPGGTVPGGEDKWGKLVGGKEIPSLRKKIWIAAIDIDYANKPDPSHPAIYLEGQELEAGNMRAFAALEPCKPNGSDCESAAECCEGFCRQTDTAADGTPITQCVPPPDGCSQVDEFCVTAADCCGADSGILCINGRCATPTPK